MRFWLFDGRQARGPFEVDELQRQPGFSSDALICPEDAVKADQWKNARHYLIKPPSGESAYRMPSAKAEPPPKPLELNIEKPKAAPRRRRPSPAQVAVFSLAVLALAALAKLRPWRRPLAATTSAEPSSDQAGPRAAGSHEKPAAPAPSEGEGEAVEFAKTFPLQSPSDRLPAEPLDVLEPKRWKPAKTVADLFEGRGLSALARATVETARKQGHSLERARGEVRQDPDGWEDYADNFLSSGYRVDWSAEPLSGSSYRVTARVRRGDAPEESHLYQADVAAKTLKPLNLEAWYDVDPATCRRWADKNVKIGAAIDEDGLRAAAPTYAARPARGAKKAAAKPKPAASEEEPQAAPAPEHEAPPQPMTSARPQPQPETIPSPTPAPQTEPKSAPTPQPTPRPQASSQTPAPSPASNPGASSSSGRKDANDMNMDELQKYLNRSPSKNP